jgi:hypothetical protein
VSISLLPIRISHLRPDRTARKHRAVDDNERLRFLLFGANLCIAGMRVQLDDQERKHAAVIARIDEQHGQIVRQLENQLADAERRLDIRTWAEAAAAKTQPIPVITAVMPLHRAPFASTDPGRVRPSWARDDEPDPAA